MERILVALFLLLACTLAKPVCGQTEDHRFGHVFVTEETYLDKSMHMRSPLTSLNSDDSITNILRNYKRPENPWNSYSDRLPKSPIALAVKLDSNVTNYYGNAVTSISKEFTTYEISDSSEAVLVALGIDSSNYRDYRYRVIRNDSVVLVDWAIPMLEKDYHATKPYGFLGKFRAPGNYIVVEVVNTKHYDIRDGIVFDWRTDYRPKLITILGARGDNAFNVQDTAHNKGYATKFDPVTRMPLNLRFPVDSIDIFAFTFEWHQTVAYGMRLIRTVDGKTDTIDLRHWTTDKIFYFEKREFSKPGKYELQIFWAQDNAHQYDHQILRLPFEVIPPPPLNKTVTIRQLLPYILGAIAVFGLSFYLYYRISRGRLRKVRQQNETISLHLRSIQSQLNPHFLFNALAAIQGLINRNEIDSANHYLSKFAGLTRQVLIKSESDMISLEDELAMLEAYLQMEQLRFGFQYRVGATAAVDLANTEIPVMLLQPFVENAVKHGVAALGQRGEIVVTVDKIERQLILTVRDNGAGFDKDRQKEREVVDGQGFGLRLSAQRIVLLNQQYKTPWVSLDVSSGSEGTLVTIRIEELG